jgi:glycosyltransferase involved in cell wall biosynthesis
MLMMFRMQKELMMNNISVYIIAYNEESKIAAAIQSVLWADEIIVADSGSTDRTAEIAREYNARIVNIPFEGFGKLRNRAVEACSNEWIFSLDSDERCTEEARDEILSVIKDPDSADAYFIPRRNYFMGRWIRYSGWYPDYRQPQLFRKSALVYREEDVVHEGFDVKGKTAYLKKPIWQFPFQNFSQIVAKMERYSNLGVEKLIAKNTRGSMSKAFIHAIGNFLRIFILKLGFLDGAAGFVIAMGNFEGTFYRYAKLVEKQRNWDKPPDVKSFNP